MRHTFGDNFWVHRVLKDIRVNARDYVITDVRFDNEALAIIERGGVIVKIIRPDAGLDGAEGAHVSEKGVSESLITAAIINDKDALALRDSILNMETRLRAMKNAA
jgi:hypothetical protein